MINTRSRRITQNVANISVDQVLDLIAGVYFNIICDLNLLKTLPPPPLFFSSLSLAQTPHLIPKSVRVINTSTPWISPHYRFRAVHADAAIPTHPRPQRPLLPHHPHHRLDLASTTRIANPLHLCDLKPFETLQNPFAPTITPSNAPPSTYWSYDLQDTYI